MDAHEFPEKIADDLAAAMVELCHTVLDGASISDTSRCTVAFSALTNALVRMALKLTGVSPSETREMLIEAVGECFDYTVLDWATRQDGKHDA